MLFIMQSDGAVRFGLDNKSVGCEMPQRERGKKKPASICVWGINKDEPRVSPSLPLSISPIFHLAF